MTHEIITPVPFDSADYNSARLGNGRYSLGRTLSVMGLSPVRLVRLVGEGHINGEKINSRIGLSTGELCVLHFAVKRIRDEGILENRRKSDELGRTK